MSLHIQLADRPSLRAAAFRGRHQTYVDADGYMPPRLDGQVRDRFDDYPTTANFVAVLDGRIVGGVRVCLDDGRGTPAHGLYDFATHLPAGARVGSGGMLWVLPEARGQRGLVPRMMDTAHRWLFDHGVTHVLGTVNPAALDGFRKGGFRPVGPTLFDEEKGVPYIPGILALADVADRLLAVATADAAPSLAA